MLRLHNTLTKKTEVFTPLRDGAVSMYNCGPTVYHFAHIGNLRAYVFADILRRALEYVDFSVTQVINVTDIGHLSSDADSGEDKMTKALIREGKPMTLSAMRDIADTYFKAFTEDCTLLNIIPATHYPFASDHVREDIVLINTLNEKGYLYTLSDGIYFDTSKFVGYGKLGGGNTEHGESRIGDHSEKRNPKDFAVWKFNNDLGFEAPFGKGFPGWHIECSAMSMKYLGETFDIHTGGIDHIPIHHNNEIAQSEASTGKPYAHTWIHSAHVIIDGGKMAKSEGNFITLRTLCEKGIHPLSYRYWLLQGRYSTTLDFTEESIHSAQNGYENLLRKYAHHKAQSSSTGNLLLPFIETWEGYIEDDLNTGGALAILHEVLESNERSTDIIATIHEMDRVFGLNIEAMSESITGNIPKDIQELAKEREEKKKQKEWNKSDAIRDTITQKGFILRDTPHGTVIEQSLNHLAKSIRFS